MAGPQLNTAQSFQPYNALLYANHLTCIENGVKQYENLIKYPDFCLGNFSTEPCQLCVEHCLQYMSNTLNHLLSILPSSDPIQEFGDLQRFSRLSKAFFKVEGNMGHWVFVLMDRKCQALYGSRLAKDMCKRGWQDQQWVTEEQIRRQHDLKEIERMRSAIVGLAGTLDYVRVPPIVTTIAGVQISNVPEWEAQVLEQGQVDYTSLLAVPAIAENGVGSLLVDNVAAESVVVDEESFQSAESQSVPGIPGDDADGKSVEKHPTSIDTKVDSGVVEVEPIEGAPQPWMEADTEESELGEDVGLLLRTGRGLDFDIIEREPTAVEAPAPPGPVADVIESGPHIEMVLPTQMARGLELNVVEREPGEVRAPAPPRFGH
ncbi:MAG: hypothetical protein Q9166_005863 [cf. Caloplaca sp. 2 TL-2023]